MKLFIKKGHGKEEAYPEFTQYEEQFLYKVASANELLHQLKRHFLIQKAQSILEQNNIEPEIIQSIYQQLFDNFVEFVQVFPRKWRDRLAGLLDYGLCRSVELLDQCHQSGFIQSEPLLSYVIITAGLLREVGSVYTHYQIKICNHQGIVIDEWQPYTGPLTSQAEFYKIRECYVYDASLLNSSTLLLARQLLPISGFTWIVNNPPAFQCWIALLNDEIPTYFAIQPMLSIWKLVLSKVDELVRLLPAVEFNYDLPKETELAEAFLAWLKSGLADGTISSNEPNAAVFRVDEGVLLECAEIFERFCQSAIFNNYPQRPAWAVVFRQVHNYLGLTKLSGEHYKFAQYFSEYPEVRSQREAHFLLGTMKEKGTIKKGVVISSVRQIFTKDLPLPDKNLKSISAIKEHNIPPLSPNTGSKPELGSKSSQ